MEPDDVEIRVLELPVASTLEERLTQLEERVARLEGPVRASRPGSGEGRELGGGADRA
jgi:hypothetical protein